MRNLNIDAVRGSASPTKSPGKTLVTTGGNSSGYSTTYLDSLSSPQALITMNYPPGGTIKTNPQLTDFINFTTDGMAATQGK